MNFQYGLLLALLLLLLLRLALLQKHLLHNLLLLDQKRTHNTGLYGSAREGSTVATRHSLHTLGDRPVLFRPEGGDAVKLRAGITADGALCPFADVLGDELAT